MTCFNLRLIPQFLEHFPYTVCEVLSAVAVLTSQAPRGLKCCPRLVP